MKKSILIVCIALTTLSLMAFGFINWNNQATDLAEQSRSKLIVVGEPTDDVNIAHVFFYDVNSRYGSTITKEDLNKVRSIAYFLSKEHIESIESFRSVTVTFIDDNYESIISETGESDVFNAAQLKLLESADYSTNILVRAEYQEKNWVTGKLEYSYTTPHLTVVPEKEAVYVSGKDALIEYLKENSKEETSIVTKNKLQPGKVSFTVTRNGTISNIKLLTTSGYTSIDKTMTKLITKAPGKWEPAENSQGEKVEQEFIFSFGIVGC